MVKPCMWCASTAPDLFLFLNGKQKKKSKPIYLREIEIVELWERERGGGKEEG